MENQYYCAIRGYKVVHVVLLVCTRAHFGLYNILQQKCKVYVTGISKLKPPIAKNGKDEINIIVLKVVDSGVIEYAIRSLCDRNWQTEAT